MEKQKINLNLYVIASISVILTILSIFISFKNKTILSYGDAEAHLNIAKRVVSSLTPGLAQLGSVWLPLQHILMVPFVVNNFLWSTGLAGSIVSGLAFVLSIIFIFKLAYLFTKNLYASYIAGFVVLLNPNALYLATTPMTEVLLFCFISGSTYYFISWVKDQKLSNLIASAFFTMCATLTRYDGWFLFVVQILILFIYLFYKKKTYSNIESKIILFSSLSGLGIFIWLLWNMLIFKDPLYFANSEYGSKAQQMWFYARGYLPTYKNIFLSITYYLTDTYLIIGSIVSILSIIGLIYFYTNQLKNKSDNVDLTPFILLFPLAFYVISLYTGQASQIIPNFAKDWYQWKMSNVRYGVHMLLPASIYIGMLVDKNKIFKILVPILLIAQIGIFINTGNILAYLDGVSGLSSQAISKGPDAIPVELWLQKNYDGGLVLMDDYRRPVGIIESGIPMDKFISVGAKPYYDESLENPTSHAKWIIIQKADTDAVWKNLKHKDKLDSQYTKVFQSGNIWVYKIRNVNSPFIYSENNSLFDKNRQFTMVGVNSYDILQKTNQEILDILFKSSENGINTIRFWAFNKHSHLTKTEFLKFDFLLQNAAKSNIKLIPVFGNQWSDYGDNSFFTSNSDSDFYTDSKAISSYKDFIKSVITRKNSFTQKFYLNDPSILSWDILNEPREENDESSDILKKWTSEISIFIKTTDVNHLTTVGTEGFMSDSKQGSYYENHGSDLKTLCEIPTIDFCSVHLYSKYLKEQNFESLFKNWKSVSDNLNKPIAITEAGFDNSLAPKNTYKIRADYFKDVSDTIKKFRINGLLIWNLSDKPDSTFSLTFDNPEDINILKTIQIIKQ